MHPQNESDQLDVLWGARAIAKFLRTTERKVFYYADRGYLPIKRQGRLLIASKSALRAHFGAEDAADSSGRGVPGNNALPADSSPPIQPAE